MLGSLEISGNSGTVGMPIFETWYGKVIGFTPATKAKLRDGQQVGHLALPKQPQITINYFYTGAAVAANIPKSEKGSPSAQVREALLEGGYVLGEDDWNIEFGSIKGRTTYTYPFYV